MHVAAHVAAQVAAQVMAAATNGVPAVVRVARIRAIERRAAEHRAVERRAIDRRAIERTVVMVPAAHSARAAPQIARSAHARTATEHRTGETLRRAIARQVPATVRPVTATENRGLKTESVRPTEATPGAPIALSALARMVSASRGRRMVLAQRVPVTVRPIGVIPIVRRVMVSTGRGRRMVSVRRTVAILIVHRVMVSVSRGLRMASVRRTVAILIVRRVMVSASRGRKTVLVQRVRIAPPVHRVTVSASPGRMPLSVAGRQTAPGPRAMQGASCGHAKVRRHAATGMRESSKRK